MDIQMDVTGLVARLESLGQQVATVGKRKALRAGGKVIERAMYLRAPLLAATTAKSTALPPGSLRNGMRTLVHEVDGDLEALAGPAAKVAHVARWVEFGHRQVKGGTSKLLTSGKTRGRGRVGGVDVPAHPFLRPAYEESVTAAVEAERVSLAETIQKAVK